MFPWIRYDYAGILSTGANGWRGWGFMTVLGSIGLFTYWIMKKMGKKLPPSIPEEKILKKIIACTMFAGPILWYFNYDSKYSIACIGYWVALAASGVLVYFAFEEIILKKLGKGNNGTRNPKGKAKF